MNTIQVQVTGSDVKTVILNPMIENPSELLVDVIRNSSTFCNHPDGCNFKTVLTCGVCNIRLCEFHMEVGAYGTTCEFCLKQRPEQYKDSDYEKCDSDDPRILAGQIREAMLNRLTRVATRSATMIAERLKRKLQDGKDLNRAMPRGAVMSIIEKRKNETKTK
jgi:hypothetical protein